MKLSLLLQLVLTDVLVSLPVVRHDYHLITTPATWSAARTYCRSKYVDLGTVRTAEDWQRLTAEAARYGLSPIGWVGLYLDVKDWYWSYQSQLVSTVLTNWAPGQPDNAGGNQPCGALDSSGSWEDDDCMGLKPFICYSASSGGFISISVTMSWYGGQTYCRKYYTDLASATTTTDISQLQQIVLLQGASWFGLFRDKWMWSDASTPVGIQWTPGFPNNADHNDNCGSVNNSGFVDRQCNSLFNFFCHTPYTVRYQVMKLYINGDESVFNSAVQSTIFQQIVQKLKEHGIWLDTNVTWRVQSDGNIIHKKLFDDL